MTPALTTLGLVLFASAPTVLPLVLQRVPWGLERYTQRALYVGLVTAWLPVVGAAAWIVHIEGRSLASAGVRWVGPAPVENPILGFFVVSGLLLAGLWVLVGLQHRVSVAPDDGTLFLSAQPARLQLALAVTAGVTEEFLFRGYVMERTLDLTGSAALAVVVSVVAFTAAHLPGDRTAGTVVSPLVLGTVFAVIYLLTRSLPLVVFLHVALDAVVLLTNDPAEMLEGSDRGNVHERVRTAAFGD